MDFSEFRLRLGADPHDRDPEFLRARDSSPEFREAAAQADRFEQQLARALSVETPTALLDQLRSIPQGGDSHGSRQAVNPTRWRYALAASLLVAIGAAGLIWRMNSGWDSVQEYVVDHYHHDGLEMLARADDPDAKTVSAMLAEFGARLEPALAGVVSVIKKCPTPDGKGVHMVLETERGRVTVIFMPKTPVTDGELIAFDDSEAVLVQLQSGSAVIIGSQLQHVSELHELVQESIITVNTNT